MAKLRRASRKLGTSRAMYAASAPHSVQGGIPFLDSSQNTPLHCDAIESAQAIKYQWATWIPILRKIKRVQSDQLWISRSCFDAAEHPDRKCSEYNPADLLRSWSAIYRAVIQLIPCHTYPLPRHTRGFTNLILHCQRKVAGTRLGNQQANTRRFIAARLCAAELAASAGRLERGGGAASR